MSPTKKTLIVVFGGMAVMVVTTVCGAATGLYLTIDDGGDYAINLYIYTIVGGAIGAVVGVPIWVWFGYMVCREKNAAPNGVIPDDSTT
jgi:ABC-type Fe3+ transport system permease subunit